YPCYKSLHGRPARFCYRRPSVDGNREPRRWRQVALAVALLAALVVTAIASAGDPEANTLRDRADDLRAENEQLETERGQALLELYATQTALERSRERLHRVSRDLDEVGERRKQAHERFVAAREALGQAELGLADRLRALYKEGDVDPLALILGARSFDEAVGAVDDLRQIARGDEQLVDQLRTARGDLRDATASLARREEHLEEAEDDARLARTEVQQARAHRAAYVRSLAREQNLNQRQIEQLTREVERAEARARAIAEELAAAAVTSSESPASTTAPPPNAPAPAPVPATPPSSPTPTPSLPDPGTIAAPGDGGGRTTPPRNGKTLTVISTAYALPGTTAIGLAVGPGIVAVDPTVIPLGTRMFIPGYGEGVAADTGSAVKGAFIDVWVPTEQEAAEWGRRTITITIY
ncbi:MAG: 3D domain-containing protein, partial [Gaiellales bacterium]